MGACCWNGAIVEAAGVRVRCVEPDGRMRLGYGPAALVLLYLPGRVWARAQSGEAHACMDGDGKRVWFLRKRDTAPNEHVPQFGDSADKKAGRWAAGGGGCYD